jgi:alkanesulfonate monooxygenase SsuD/methylene tetrahydromethanopterin reductase-like flavin-dependent oxidoreductase (luciferase family)
MANVMKKKMENPYELLLGRRTYEILASHWPHVKDDPEADRLNSARKYVVSHSDMGLEWQNSMMVTGDVVTKIRGLLGQDGPDLWVHGSGNLIQTLLANGALLLPHYKPLKVAESFHLLASLYPGRVDLGLGRAPGGSAEVSLALSDNFLENVWKMPELLKGVSELLEGTHKFDGRPITARPTPPVPPELWLLGTNRKSAAYAAEFGTGYVFGQFMSEVAGEEVLDAYRKAFTPSGLSPVPRAIVAIGVVCAETEEEAEQLASTGKALFQQEDTTGERAHQPDHKLLVGTPESLNRKLEQLSLLYGVDEFIIVTMIPDYRKRLRSFELLARAVWKDK